ncbi:MAG: DEAD/DEAH box helicase [Oscillospiraceae bacterium]|nr:DEAD/DEAH box helicase [Oscillospiraceae bacterium]
MEDISFSELNLMPKIQMAIDEMGFDVSTEIQAKAIPMIRSGVDVIGRSQTGTGKTIAFAIPAIEKIDTDEERSTVQVLILCPTRELAQQGCEEIKKLIKYKSGIYPVEVYGGAPMDRQIMKLRKANIVIGTPGRVMDHMRRRTLKLDNLKMVVLDEADEMLSMGFKEDIETILIDTPADRQTVLFSATMPASIMALTKQFQKNPKVIEINKAQVTLENINQAFVDVPMGRKMDALNLLLRFYSPKLAMIFCNTKSMVDDVSGYLTNNGFNAEGLHGDMKQAQRTKVMDSFKYGKTAILVATDVAARGIDVNDVDYVINFDIPQNVEYYVHRIGRTGRAGKAGKALTICSGRHQAYTMRSIAFSVKSEINEIPIPSVEDINAKSDENHIIAIEEALNSRAKDKFTNMAQELISKGYEAEKIAAVMLQLHFGTEETHLKDIKVEARSKPIAQGSFRANGDFQKIVIDIGRSNRVAPNHIVGAITERTSLSGKDIGKIEIFDDRTVVAVPSSNISSVVDDMVGCKICGQPTKTALFSDKQKPAARRYYGKNEKDSNSRRTNGYRPKRSY